MTALQAVQSRDAAALVDAFSDLEEAKDFKNNVLPRLSAEECRWFWVQVMPENLMESLVSHVRDTCLRIANELDLAAGVHYSLGMVDDLPTMICSEQVARVFYARLPRERHSVLRFYLQTTDL